MSSKKPFFLSILLTDFLHQFAKKAYNIIKKCGTPSRMYHILLEKKKKN